MKKIIALLLALGLSSVFAADAVAPGETDATVKTEKMADEKKADVKKEKKAKKVKKEKKVKKAKKEAEAPEAPEAK